MKTLKRSISLFLVMAIMFTNLYMPIIATGNNMTITATSSADKLNKDETFTITVTVGPTTQAIGAMQIQLEYDPAKIEYQSSANGELGNKFTSQKSVTNEGTYVDAMYAVNDEAIANEENSVLFTATFKILTAASENVTPTLKVGGDIIYDGDYAEIPYTLVDATVTANPVHEHTFNKSVWSKDETHHWHPATCEHTDEKDSYVEHIYDQDIIADEYRITDGDCMMGPKYFKSCICGAKPATETENNVHYGEMLDHQYGELVPAVEEKHTQDELVASVAAHYQCSVCEKYFVDESGVKAEKQYNELVGQMPRHNYTNLNGYKAEDGHADTCSCGAYENLEPHEPNIPAATEDAPQLCAICSYELAPMLEHTHRAEKKDGKSPECTVDGYKEYYSCKCGYYEDEDCTVKIEDLDAWIIGDGRIPATHNYGNLIPAVEEKHTKTELVAAVAAHYFCDECDTYFTEEKVETTLVALTGEVPTHDSNAWVDTDSTRHWNKCSICGLEYSEASEPHDFTNGDCECGREKIAASMSTTLDNAEFKVGTVHEFTFSTVANDDAGVMVVGVSNFSNPEAIEKLEYYEVMNNTWYELTDSEFGPSNGFPMSNATSKFRVTFKTAGEYTFTASMVAANDKEKVICTTDASFTILEKVVPVLSTNIGDQIFKAGGDWVEFTFSTVANDYAGEMVYGGSDFGVAYEDKIAGLEYKAGDQWIDMKGQNFGGENGFPMADATSTFRVKFTEDAAGEYTFTAAMKRVSDDKELCTLEVPFEVVEKIAPVLSTDIDEKTFKAGGDWVEFTFSTVANDYAGVMVTGGSDFGVAYEDKIAGLEYKAGDQWIDMKGQNFGGANGFPMADATSTFRVKFTEDAAGEYNFTAAMKRVADEKVLCELDVPFTVGAKSSGNGGGSGSGSGSSGSTGGGTVKPSTPPATECPSEHLKDVEADTWYHDAVDYVVNNGLMIGTSDDTFGINDATSRGMIVTILYRLEDSPEINVENIFEDVKAGTYYEKAVIWANENGIVEGYGNGKFGPEDSITREQLATIMFRYAKYKNIDVSVGENTNILSYDDALEISEWAIEAMQWAVGADIIDGTSNSTLSPAGNAARTQAAAILMRFCENVAK